MAKTPYYLSNDKDTFNIKEEFKKYARNWLWFVVTIFLFLLIAFFYLKYATVNYETVGKVKILDDSSKAIELPGDISSLFESSKVNLENEIEVIKSHLLLERVTKSLNLNVTYFEEGNIKSKELWNTPFKVFAIDSINKLPENKNYTIQIVSDGYNILESETKAWQLNEHDIDSAYRDLPFLIKSVSPSLIKRHLGKTYTVKFSSIRKATIWLSSSLKVSQIGKNSDILSLSIIGDSNLKSEMIINEVINQFNLDGILDRQLVSQRTIDFVDDRFAYLTKELDSIENGKRGFKQKNSLSDIRLDTEYTIVNKTNTFNEVLRLETQLEIATLLKETLNDQETFGLLPANIGLENAGINGLINDYNVEANYRNKVIHNAGINNPIIQSLETKLTRLKANILKSVIAYEKQTGTALKRARRVNNKTKGLFSGIPQKEKILRSIERQQTIKETLYILLLEKREEAAINLAITSPSIKVVDYAITKPKPVSPKKSNTYFVALSLGLIIPFIFFYIIFFIDSKVHTKEDILAKNGSIPITGEIPFSKEIKLIKGTYDRSILSEAYRVLRTNIDHLLKGHGLVEQDGLGKVVYITSTIKGEGKTFTAANLALSYLGLNKKVLLIGADFRNPQIHHCFNLSRTDAGLSNYLNEETLNYEDLVINLKVKDTRLDILLSGNVPPSPAALLSNSRFEKLLDKLKREYDYIVVDTAPTILVTDTMLIAPYANTTLYVVRSRFTDKKLLSYSNELIETNKLVNVSYLINGLIPSRLYGYNYNYGYNYGYNDNSPKKRWKLKIFR
ncbi:polysaccharide biosynthesis tyrosine autokinase [Flavivirga algicola]|uniref:non-specific protein-tyrosine kinase n=1 Tax=Flavivirga algicola TaxID=2729136 RepID=A0ABX1RVQ9_9FLAO|nr:polysaccharide biosynthesis tyrosine autokinase [Flavivirga algicola]NMH87641.1 polysaccharide biosynthesis tyrosine autokinase [Flavivirga algicola]